MSQALFLFNWTPIDRRYLPGRGLLGSVIVHGTVALGLLFVSLPGKVTERAYSQEEVTYIDLKDPNELLYLPVLLNDDPGGSPPREESKFSTPVRAAASVPKPKGLSYPGPQQIDSDFPEPTNSILTVLQPAIANPQILQPPLVLPNIVQMAAVSVPSPSTLARPQVPATPEVLLNVKPVELPVQLAPPPVDVPKPVPPPVVAVTTVVPEAKPSPPSPPPPPPAPEIARPAPAPSAKPADSILVLTPMPAPRQETLRVPSGEARGNFTVSPEANIASLATQPGSRVESPASTAAIAAKADAGNSASNAPKDKVSPGSGATPGPAAGTASGTGTGNNKNAFPGITILGGPSDTGNTKSSGNIISIGTPPPPLQTSYGITIVSTEGSGGGLPQYGVFSNDQIFTVYLDMRRTVSDPAPSWTFEYAVLKPAANPAAPAASPSRTSQGLVLPFPIAKEQPALPAELVRKYVRLRIIVYAVINTEGKMEQISVKESPDSMLNLPVLDALSKWAFRPAQLDGEKVPVKVLIGIPLS